MNRRRLRFGASLGALVFVACLGDPVGPGMLTVAVLGANPDTAWIGAPGEDLPRAVRVIVTDGNGNPVAAAAVTWETVGTGATVIGASTQTDEDGQATATWRLGTNASEEQRLRVAVQTQHHGTELNARARGVPYIVAKLHVASDSPAVLRVGDTLQLRVDAIDPYGNVFPAPDLTSIVGDSAFGKASGARVVGGPRRGNTQVEIASHGITTTLPVHVTQLVAAIEPALDTMFFSSLGAVVGVSYQVRDDRGRLVADTSAALAVTDTTVVRLEGTTVRSLTTGRSAVTFQLSPANASLPVAVEQRIASLRFVRDTIRFDALLDTTTLRPIARDSLGFEVHTPALVIESGNGQVANVSAALLTALGPGLTTVTVTDPETGVATTVPVVVHPLVRTIEATAIAFDAFGELVTPVIVARDRLGSPVAAANLSYAIDDPSVVGLGPAGQLLAIKVGQVTFTVTDVETGTTTQVPVTVRQRIANLALDVDSLAFDALSDARQVAPAAYDRLGSAVADVVARTSYSSTDTLVIKAAPDGSLRSVGNGVALLIAQSSDGPADTVRVVVAQRVATVAINRDNLVFDALQAEQGLTGAALDRLGSPVVGAEVAFAVDDPSVALVDGSGVVRALSNGSTQLLASAGGVTVPLAVVVAQRAVRVVLPTDTVRLDAFGDTTTVRGVALDSLGSAIVGANLSYSIDDPSVVGVDPAGQLRAIRVGQVTFTVSDVPTGTAAQVPVAVRQRITNFALDIDSLTFDALSAAGQITPSARDRLGSVVADVASRTSYSSTDTLVIRTSPDGSLRSVGNGVAVVVAQSNDGPADSARVVVAQQVASVQVDRNSLVFDALRAEQGLIGAALDRLGNAVVGAAVAYTAEDSSVVHVDETGTVRALNNGATQVIASARGVAVPIPVVVAQRAVRVQVPQDTIRLAALAVPQAITGQAFDSLGSPVAGQVTALAIADTTVIKAVDSATVRSAQNGVTTVAFRIADASASVVIDVRQVATSLTAVLNSNQAILDRALGSSLPVVCHGYDANGYAVPDIAILASTSRSTVNGGSCANLQIQRSGYDTLVFTSGLAQTTLPILVAVSPTADFALGTVISVDSLPAPTGPWAPSVTRGSNGGLAVYYAAFSALPDSSGRTRGDLHRLEWLGGNQFRYDSIAIRHDDNICSPQGQGIENVVVVPRAEGAGWRMFFAAGSNKCYGWQVFSATSDDGRIWTKEPGIRLSNGGVDSTFPPPWPAGEGMVVDQLPSGEWRMIVSTFEHITPPASSKWEITEWRSPDQLQWQYIGTVLTTRDMPVGWQGSVYSPSIRQIAPGLWRMVFTADGRGTPGTHSAIWSAVSTDLASWQIEGEIIGAPGSNLYYSSFLEDRVVYVRRDGNGSAHLATARLTMP